MSDAIALLIAMVIGGGVGVLVGAFRGRASEGGAWGALLGPVGWLVVLLRPDLRRRCPACLGPVPVDASRCRHCGGALVAMTAVRCPACGEAGQVPTSDRRAALVCPTCHRDFVPGGRLVWVAFGCPFWV